MDWHEAIKKWGQQQRLLNQAKIEEENNNLEAAFELYQQAAALGIGDAMVAIGNLYAVKNFRMKETYDFLEHVLKGIPLMPYNLTKKQEPDFKTALEWYIKAAELDHPDGCFAAGAMLCEGKGCESNVERGLMYLRKADEKGMPSARQVICIYDPTESLYLSDDEYDKLLEQFVQAVDTSALDQFELYSRLKGGTESQQTRLGYTLITRRNLEDPKYQSFKYLFSPEGIPLLPCCARRGAWKSFVRVDLNAFRSDDIYIAFATDISNSFVESSRLTPVGSAVYRSPAFGWLGEEKNALVLKVDRTCVSQQIQEIAAEFGLHPKEYAEENAAFIVENGEKEYSVEFAVIDNGKVHVLYRYTIDGPDVIYSSFEPELISLNIDKHDKKENKLNFKYVDCDGNACFPEGITEIGEEAFFGCTSLVKAVIPNSVTKIGAGAFFGCTSLTELVIPNSVTKIGHSAFAYCTSLTKAAIPEGVTKMVGMFHGCTNLAKLIIPNSITEIGDYAFNGCTNLTIQTPKGSCGEQFAKKKNIPYTVLITDSVTETGEPVLSESTNRIFVDNEGNACFPEGITEIPDYAFDENKELKYAILPNTVERIGKRAFAECSNLEKLILNDNLKAIAANAFTDCESLKKIDFPDSMQEVHGFAFYDTYFEEPVISRSGKIFYRCPLVPGRKTYKVPDDIKEIQDGAFLYHEELEEVILPEGLEKIHMRAFCNTGIKRITIPSSVKELSSSAFMSCEKLEEVTMLCDIKNLPYGVFENCFEYGSQSCINITAPGQTMTFDKLMMLQGMSVADIQKEVAPPNMDFWQDNDFVLLTEKCVAGDSSAMIELGNYYTKWKHEFCVLASNYWYYAAYLCGNEEAVIWYDKWFLENPKKKIPMPILPNKMGKNFDSWVHDEKSCYEGAILRALGFSFFSEKRTYRIFHFYEPGLVQISSWCSDEDPYGGKGEYDWWMLDEFFNELPGVKMIHAYTFHDRIYACTKTFDEQYESAKRAIENKKLQSKERNNKL